MRFTALLGTLSVLAGVIASCSDDPPAEAPAVDAGPDGPPPLGADANAFVSTLCSIHQPCCAPVTGAGTKCITETSSFARGKTFDAARAAACLEVVRAEAATVGYCGRGPDAITCAGVFKSAGPKAPGEACRTASDCASAPDAEGLCVERTCRHVRRGKEGDPCIGTRRRGKTDEPDAIAPGSAALCFVADGLHCDATTAKCTKRGATGAPCSAAPGACADTAWCNEARQCAARVAKGAKCTSLDACVAGMICSAGTCIAVAAEGAACIRGNECDPAASLVCDTNVTKCVADTAVYEETCSGAAALLR